LTLLQVREGFIVDEDEEDDDEARERRRRRDKKRRREQREEEVLDDEDLDLIGEANPEWERKTTQQVGLYGIFFCDFN
jgi:transcription elongation factor SPT6